MRMNKNLQGRWCSLYQQATILGQCKSVTSNDDRCASTSLLSWADSFYSEAIP